MLRILRNLLEMRRGQPDEDVRDQQRTPFQRMPVPDESRSTMIDPDRGIVSQTQRSVYFFDCGHISSEPVGGGRCYACGGWACACCISICSMCGALLCNRHSINSNGLVLCPNCAENLKDRIFFNNAVNVIKAVLLFPFIERK